VTSHSELDPNDPWLGLNFLDPVSRERIRRDPYPLFDNLRRVDPVHQTPIGVWQIARHTDVLYVLRDAPVGVRTAAGGLPGLAPSLPDWGPGQFMLSQDPPSHTRLRKLVSKAFTPRAVERLRPRARALAEQCVSGALARGRMEVIEELALRIPATLICELMGIPSADQARFTAWTARATHLLTATLGNPDLGDAREAGAALAEYFRALHAERRARSSNDLMSQLVRAEEEGDRLSENELLSQSIGLLIAGFETTIGLIGNGVLALLRHPAQLARLRAEPALLACAVEECLRYDGPISLTIRVAHADFELGGKSIPKDAILMALVGSANRDPDQFEAPERFDVARDPNPHLAFGGGTHFCLGAHLARMEAQEAIGALVRRTESLELAVREDELAYGASLFRVLAALPVTLA
jgi:cytochrome P450